ncbi:MAG: hypothetical protein AAF458_09590 [Pseudomonadota bacterium]
MKGFTRTAKTLLKTSTIAMALTFSAVSEAAIFDFDFSAPGTRNESLGLSPQFMPVNDFEESGLNVIATASATQSGQLEVHRNRNNGLGVTGGRNDPHRNRINSHSSTDGDDMESLTLTFSVPVHLMSITFKAVGRGSSFALMADPSAPLSSPIVGAPTNGRAIDMSAFGIVGTEFSVSAAGFGQSLRVHSLQVAMAELASASTTATASAPATSALLLAGMLWGAARRRKPAAA